MEMMNLNDTISAFRCCTQIPPRCKKCPLTEMCKWNLSRDRCKNEVKLSVNHWLQAQEPVAPIRRSAHAQGADDVWYECGGCGKFLGVNRYSKQHCDKCGRAVKWELTNKSNCRIPADIAQKLGIKPKE